MFRSRVSIFHDRSCTFPSAHDDWGSAALPDNSKVSKEAKDCIQECVSEFIGFVTNEASDRLKREKRKTVTGLDLIVSMRALGFDDYLPYLELFLDKYRKVR